MAVAKPQPLSRKAISAIHYEEADAMKHIGDTKD
jgi:hypothetical protein